MKVSLRIVLQAVLLVGLALVFAPAASAASGDDTAGFSVQVPMQVGRFTLEPGLYLVRAVHDAIGHNVLVVTDPDATKVFATVLATPHSLASHEIADHSRLRYVHSDTGQPAMLRTFLVANKSLGYDVYTSKPRVTAVAAVREIVAIAEGR